MDTKTYFFQPEKKALKQGFFLEDEDKSIVYEAKVLKQPLLGPAEFEFVNHITNAGRIHKIGHTITSETSGMLQFFSAKSHFRYDGEKIWDYLHDKGVRIESHLSGNRIGMTYTVSLKGQEIATIASAAVNGGKGSLTGGFTYHVTTAEEYLDPAFLVTFAIARTEQVVYD